MILLAVIALFSACGDTEELYSRHPCRLFFDNARHNNAILAGAMTVHSNVFVTIMASGKQFVFASNQGLNSVVNMTALDVQRGYILGMNNGIIVGYGKFEPVTFYAYDRECPNCFDFNALPVRSYPLTVHSSGIATCSKCRREYDLSNGGIVSKGDAGKKMTRYRATTTGPYGILNI